MTRRAALVCVVLLAGFGPGVRAAEPPAKLTPEQRKALEARWDELNTAGEKTYGAGKHAEALKAWEAAAEPREKDAVVMQRRLLRGGHPSVARSLNNLGALYKSEGKYAAAEPLYKDALAMRQRLFKDDHPEVAQCLNNLGYLYWSQG